jgi:hypothetical protein
MKPHLSIKCFIEENKDTHGSSLLIKLYSNFVKRAIKILVFEENKKL